MKLFVDEDVGPGVARALIVAGLTDVDYVADDRRFKKGTPDEQWMIYVGKADRLVLSSNKSMLNVDVQRSLLVRERIGIVFVPANMILSDLVQLILGKREWLESIATTEARPFAFTLHRTGHVTRRPLRS